MAIHDWSVLDTRFAVVDIETTGLQIGRDAIVEIAVVHVDPGQTPVLALHTLIKPDRHVTGTEIHGLTDTDVRDAPRFADVAPHLLRALSGRVLAAHNIHLELPFLGHALEAAKHRTPIPYLSTLLLRPLLGLGDRCSLEAACESHGVSSDLTHHAAADAVATAELLTFYLEKCEALEVRTFQDLLVRRDSDFTRSFAHDPPALSAVALQPFKAVVRGDTRASAERQNAGMQRYHDALIAAVADLEITGAEKKELARIAADEGLAQAHVRALHARLFAAYLGEYIDDQVLDTTERKLLKKLRKCLKKLGWAPGD